MKKGILVTASTFPRWKNDVTARFVYDLSVRLGKFYDVTVLAPHHKGALKDEKIDNILVKRFIYFFPESLQKLCYGGGIIPNMNSSFLARIQMPSLIFSEFIAAAKIIKERKIDVLHAHWMLPQGLVGVFLKKIFGIKLLVTIHGSDLFPLKNYLFNKLQKYTLKNADVITVNTEATRKELESRFKGFSSKVRIIPMGVDCDLFKKKKVKKKNRTPTTHI